MHHFYLVSIIHVWCSAIVFKTYYTVFYYHYILYNRADAPVIGRVFSIPDKHERIFKENHQELMSYSWDLSLSNNGV